MRIFKKSLPIIIGLLAFLCLNLLLNYLFIPYQFTRMKVHRVETETFQDLILGSSHGCAAFDPSVISEATGRTCFNAAAGGQYPMDNYYLLKDACREHTPQRVIYEFDPAYWISIDGFNRVARYQVDVMRLSTTKAAYFRDLCLNGDFRYVLMPWFLYKDSFLNLKRIVSVKQSEDYRNYGTASFSNSYQTCREDGFTAIHGDGKRNMTVPVLSFGEDKEKQVRKNRDYFEKTAAFCRNHDIELIVVTTPVPEETAEANSDFYREAHEMMSELSDQYGFVFRDYVYADDAEGSRNEKMPSEDFSDGEGHMFEDAAKRFSAGFAENL